MSTQVQDILKSPRKPKEKVAALTDALRRKRVPMKEFMAFFESARDADKGTCADVFKHLSGVSPELFGPHVEALVRWVNYPAPRVKWGVSEALGNLAEKFPRQAAKAGPALLRNAGDPSTVVRWCAAYALTKIMKADPAAKKQLAGKVKKIVAEERNNGVRGVYEKAGL